MPNPDVTVMPSQDQEAVDRLFELSKNRQTFPAERQIGGPEAFRLAWAGALDPAFRAANVDPILAARRDRPGLEAAFNEKQNAAEIAGINTALGASQGIAQEQRAQQQDQRAVNALAMAQADKKKKNAVVAAKTAALLGSQQESTTEFRDVAQKLSKVGNPTDQKVAIMIKSMADALDALRSTAAQNPDVLSDEDTGTQFTEIENSMHDLMGHLVDQERLATENEKRANQALEIARIQNAGNGSSGGDKVPTAVSQQLAGMETVRQFIAKAKEIVDSGVGGPIVTFFGKIPFTGDQKELASKFALINSMFLALQSGKTVSDKEYDRLSPTLPNIGSTQGYNDIKLKSLDDFMSMNADALSRRFNAIQQGADPAMVQQQIPLNFKGIPGLEDGDVLLGESTAGGAPGNTAITEGPFQPRKQGTAERTTRKIFGGLENAAGGIGSLFTKKKD